MTRLFEGPGAVRARGRAMDWSSTPLGPPELWSPTLRGAVRTALASPFPTNLWCGPELALVYNDAYASVLGAKHPDALGQPGAEVWAEIWDDIRPMFEGIRVGQPAVYAEDAPFVVHRGDGDDARGEPNAWFTFSLSPVRDEDGELVAFLNVVSETTARIMAERAFREARADAKRADARLLDVFAGAPSFLAVLRGPAHVFEYVNDAYLRLVGHRDVVGRPIFEALPEVRGQGFEELLDRVLATGEPYVGTEVPVMVRHTRDAEPEHRFVDLVYYPIEEADGSCSGVVAHGTDVTDHVLARREALRARAAAEHANRAKSRFLANMSHEIRTPINAIIGYADLLQAEVGGSLGDLQRDYVARIRRSSAHLIELVSEVLDFAKIESGELPVEKGEVEVAEVARAALEMVARDASVRGIALEEDDRCDPEARVVGSEHRVRQILLNLLSNALKFTHPGGTVTLRCREGAEGPPGDAAAREGGEDAGGWVVFDVEDTGIGIPPEDQERIFEPFVQVEGEHTRSAGGTGLGLSISQRFARMMGGDLTVSSEPGRGSRFSLWLAAVGNAAASARDSG